MNTVAIWLKLIGNAERARKLRARLDSLESPDLDPNFGLEPPQCPTTVLYGAETSRKLYSDPDYRPGLDAWDNGSVTKGDLRRYCLWIEKGSYLGPIFYPDASWQAHLRSESKQNAANLASLRQTRMQPAWESPASPDHVKRPASRDTAHRTSRA